MEYDWNSVQVGRPELNDSQNFFRIRHVLHEKAADLKAENRRSIDENIVTAGQSTKNSNPAKSKPVQQCNDKENVSVNHNNNRAILAVSMIKNPKHATGGKQSILKHVLKKSHTVPPPPSAASSSSHVSKKPPQATAKPQTNKDIKPVLKSSYSQGAIRKTVSVPNGHRQFEYAESIAKRREELVKKLKDQEEKSLKYNFHANPAPKFKKISSVSRQTSVDSHVNKLVKHASLPTIPILKKTSKENIVPSCGDPERLKYLDEKKRMLIAKYQEPKIHFKAKPADVLKKQPFQPIHNMFKAAEAKPFKLQITERLLLRSEFDKKLHETIAVRKMQEDVRQRQQDLQERKLMRQKTEFKARANPFRNYH